MINAIIGAEGDMGKNLLCPLLSQMGKVIKIEKNSSKQKRQKAWSADVIWLSVPRETIPAILKDVKLGSSQLVVDICSVKKNISGQILKTGATHLSLHPLQGPLVPLGSQKWVVINPIFQGASGRILAFLKNRGVALIKAKSEQEHDFMMSAVLCMPEFMTVVMDLLLKYLAAKKSQRISLKKLLKWSTPAFNALSCFYIHSINSSAPWLRAELAAEFANWGFQKIGNKKLEKMLANQHAAIINELSRMERVNVGKFVNRWYSEGSG